MGYYANARLEAYAYKLRHETDTGNPIYVDVPSRQVKQAACPVCGTPHQHATCYGEFGYYQRTCIMICTCGNRYVVVS